MKRDCEGLMLGIIKERKQKENIDIYIYIYESFPIYYFVFAMFKECTVTYNFFININF